MNTESILILGIIIYLLSATRVFASTKKETEINDIILRPGDVYFCTDQDSVFKGELKGLRVLDTGSINLGFNWKYLLEALEREICKDGHADVVLCKYLDSDPEGEEEAKKTLRVIACYYNVVIIVWEPYGGSF